MSIFLLTLGKNVKKKGKIYLELARFCPVLLQKSLIQRYFSQLFTPVRCKVSCYKTALRRVNYSGSFVFYFKSLRLE